MRSAEKRIKGEVSQRWQKERDSQDQERRWADVCNAINRQDLTTFISLKERRIQKERRRQKRMHEDE